MHNSDNARVAMAPTTKISVLRGLDDVSSCAWMSLNAGLTLATRGCTECSTYTLFV